MKRIMVLPTLVFLFSSCGVSSESQNGVSSFENAQEACSEYLRAFTEEANLDPFGDAVVEALDIPELTSATENMDSELEQLEAAYPGLTSENMSTSEALLSVEINYGPSAAQALRDYGQVFIDVDQLIRKSCDGLELLGSTSIP
jgi:hypothetical protein